MPLNPGQILHHRYRIARLLAQGGFGAVYKAWDTTLNIPCAVKESFELSPQGQRQFLREAQILAGLRHPNLPRVSDFFALPGQGQYLVMDFVEGQDLEELRAQASGRLPEAQALTWISQVCDALGYLHRQKPAVIHRDIKPANIKITPPDEDYPQGRAMLVDFGVAKTYDPAMRTTMGARAITPGYSPHEQYGQANAVTDARTDVYALGATLYTLLTGEVPPESVLRLLRDPLVPPRQLNPAISPPLEAALLQAMHNDPELRFQSAAEFKAALRREASAARKPPAAVVTQPPATLPFVPAGQVAPAPAPLPAGRAGAGGGIFSLPWKWVGIGGGLLAGLALLAGVVGLLIKSTADSRATQTAQARGTQTEDFIISPVDGMLLRYIPAGTFQMGAEDGDSDELPVHTVTLDAFWMDQTEVTNAMYALCVADGVCSSPQSTSSYTRDGYYGEADYADYPVIWVDWHRAQAYCTWAGRRLPTEAEWEYAARGGLAGATYPWGNDAPSCTLDAQNGAQYNPCSSDDTIAVGSFAPNGYGLYDMAGNVWEWVADWYSADYYSSSPGDNPTGPTSGVYRALRGGAWVSIANVLRVSSRVGYSPGNTRSYIGFRCARSP